MTVQTINVTRWFDDGDEVVEVHVHPRDMPLADQLRILDDARQTVEGQLGAGRR